MPCPWYQYGLCTSPKLSEPTDVVVAADRCNSEDIYVNCVYYIGETPKGSAKKSSSTRKNKVKLYLPIHAIPPQVECLCPECEISTSENGVKIAYCKILDRYLTRYEVYICSKHWKECPYGLSQHI